ncbi:MAG: helix-turn-helix transcriptional regulator [Ruminococcus sp.]|nr:helix-turn-helix transcriptional regulator [Ruminococcus sp.]
MYFRLKDLREDKDMSQEEVGKVIKTSAAYYGAYEIGKRDLPLERAITLAKFYSVSLDYLAGLTNDKGGLHCNFLESEEKELIEAWRGLSTSNKQLIKANIVALSDRKPSSGVKKSVG